MFMLSHNTVSLVEAKAQLKRTLAVQVNTVWTLYLYYFIFYCKLIYSTIHELIYSLIYSRTNQIPTRPIQGALDSYKLNSSRNSSANIPPFRQRIMWCPFWAQKIPVLIFNQTGVSHTTIGYGGDHSLPTVRLHILSIAAPPRVPGGNKHIFW